MKANNIKRMTIATYDTIFETGIYRREQIIKSIRSEDQRSWLITIGYLLNNLELGPAHKLKYLRGKPYSKSVINKFLEFELYSKQGLLYFAKWIIAYGRIINELFCVEISEELINKTIITQIMLADYLPSDNIDSAESYMFKNVAINSKRNIKNDLARSYQMFIELSRQKDLYNEKEYIDFYEDYKTVYSHSINEYLAMMFPMVELHFTERPGKIPIINIDKFSSKMKIKQEFIALIRSKAQCAYDFTDWCQSTIENTWDYSLFLSIPFIDIGDGWILSLHEDFVINQYFEGLFYRIREVYPEEDKSILTFLGSPYEKYVDRLTAHAVAEAKNTKYTFIPEFKFGKTKRDSSDAYIRSGKKLLIIEAKSKRPNFEIYYTHDLAKLMEGIKKVYISPINQAIDAHEAILESRERTIFDGVEEIYVLSVTLLNVPRVSEIQKYVDDLISNKLGEKLKGHINLSIEEFEYLCGVTKKGVELFDFLEEFCDRKNLSPLVNFLESKGINDNALQWIDDNYMKFAEEARGILTEL